MTFCLEISVVLLIFRDSNQGRKSVKLKRFYRAIFFHKNYYFNSGNQLKNEQFVKKGGTDKKKRFQKDFQKRFFFRSSFLKYETLA